jgi:hypothetical protein
MGIQARERLDAGGRMYRSGERGVVTNDRQIGAIGDNHAGTLSAALIARVPPGFVQGLADICGVALSCGSLTAGPEIRK